MRRAIMFSLSVLLALGMLTLGAVPAQAKATKTSFTGAETVVFEGIPQKLWVADGILHVRGLMLETTFVGTISWTNSVVVNVNMNPATGDGTAWGTFAVTLTSGAILGTFEGHHVGKFTAGCGFLRFVGHGIGNLEGMSVKGTAIQDPSTCGPSLLGLVWIHEGIILNPHG